MKINRWPSKTAAIKLLRECGLPIDDLQHNHFETFFGCDLNDTLAGLIGLELYNPVGLLRSLAVRNDYRNRGCGRKLVQEAERFASAHDVERLYLLTTTAEEYFSRLGYSPENRSEIPEPIKRTQEFSRLCPETAIIMVKPLAR